MNTIRTVLLVDDDEVTNYLNIRLVTNLKISKRLEIRNNGKEALEYLKECDELKLPRPELILLDLQMPCMDGKQFLEEYDKRYGKENNKTRIILLSATKHRLSEALCERHNIEHFVLKPLTPQKLQEAICSHIA